MINRRWVRVFLLLAPLSLSCSNPPITAPTPALATEILLEAETGSGAGSVIPRGSASRSRTVSLQVGETRVVNLNVAVAGSFSISVRYSNDGLPDVVQILVDDKEAGQFTSQPTGSGGFGWDMFAWADKVAVISLNAGTHQISLTDINGDIFGIEIDVVKLTREPSNQP